MNVLLIGSGAREHAITRAIKRSPRSTNLFCFASSNNPGIQELSAGYTTGKVTDTGVILNFAKQNSINWAFIGPEAPLEAGVADVLWNNNIPCIGPKQNQAQLETSKHFTRDLLTEYNIPGCPRYKYFSSMDGIRNFLNELEELYVVKADGLMGGKGVKVAGDHLNSHSEAMTYCQELINLKKTFVIEEKLIGQEFSLMSFCDGEHLAHMPAVQDHKRAYVGDRGSNTGGMGCYTDSNHSLPFLTNEDIRQAQKINQATAEALKNKFSEGYKGILYGGFIATRGEVKLIEYNARLGDPEAMNVLSILESDFVELCQSIVNGNLNQEHAKFARKATVCKYAVPDGYPDCPIKNQLIDISQVENVMQLYLAAVDQKPEGLYETGSRTAAVVGIANSITEAEKIAEEQINKIIGPLFHRSDIGTDELIQNRTKIMHDLKNNPSKSTVNPENPNSKIEGTQISQMTKIKPDNMPIRLAILGSTRGTDMQAIIDAIKSGELNANIEIVISNKPNAYILERARKHNLRAVHIPHKGKTRPEFDRDIVAEISKHNIDLVLLIGYMQILSPVLTNAFPNKIYNVHPSLLPKFTGGMDTNVHAEVLKSGETETGCTIHIVTKDLDAGPIVLQKKCRIESNDTVETLKEKVQKLEGEAFVEVIKSYKNP